MGCDLQFEKHTMLFSLSCDYSTNILEECFFSMPANSLRFSFVQVLHTKIEGAVILVSLCLFKFIIAQAKLCGMLLPVALRISGPLLPSLSLSLSVTLLLSLPAHIPLWGQIDPLKLNPVIFWTHGWFAVWGDSKAMSIRGKCRQVIHWFTFGLKPSLSGCVGW